MGAPPSDLGREPMDDDSVDHEVDLEEGNITLGTLSCSQFVPLPFIPLPNSAGGGFPRESNPNPGRFIAVEPAAPADEALPSKPTLAPPCAVGIDSA